MAGRPHGGRGGVGMGGGGWAGESGGLVMCLFDRCQIGIIERRARKGWT